MINIQCLSQKFQQGFCNANITTQKYLNDNVEKLCEVIQEPFEG